MRRRAPQSELGTALRKRFASNVRRIRLKKGMTQQQLAAAAALDRSFIIRIEKGQFSVTLETVGAVATALGVPPALLLADDEPSYARSA